MERIVLEFVPGVFISVVPEEMAQRAQEKAELLGHPGHFHCEDGCDKSAGVWSDQPLWSGEGHRNPLPRRLVCVRCGAAFEPCTPDTCPEAFQ